MKNPDVEEPIDLALHRPLGFLVARAALYTPVTADALTIVSMLCGIAAGVSVYVGLGGAAGFWLAGALFILSAVFDCSDGQLARMRGSSSRWGRMLDGAVDAVVQIAVLPAAVLHMVQLHGGLSSGEGMFWAVSGVLAILAGIRHTTLYDHFKNVYVRNTESQPKDCDDADDVERDIAQAQAQGPLTLMQRFRFGFYRTHLKLVAQTIHVIDPHIPSRFKDMPPYTPARAERFRALNRRLMRGWSLFGIGTHIFLFGVCLMANTIELYVVIRLVGFNLLLAALVPAQRRASRAFFGEPPVEPLRAAA